MNLDSGREPLKEVLQRHAVEEGEFEKAGHRTGEPPEFHLAHRRPRARGREFLPDGGGAKTGRLPRLPAARSQFPVNKLFVNHPSNPCCLCKPYSGKLNPTGQNRQAKKAFGNDSATSGRAL